MFLCTHDRRRKWKPVAPLPIIPIKTNLKAAQMAERYAALEAARDAPDGRVVRFRLLALPVTY